MKTTNEGSGTKNLASPAGTGVTDLALLGKFGNTSASFRTAGKDSPVQRHRKKMKPNKPLASRGFGEDADKFQESIVRELLGLNEVVRQKGGRWALYDDETGSEIASFDDRKKAWARQRLLRQQSKISGPDKKKKKKPQQSKQEPHAPKLKNAQGLKAVRPIKSIKPIKPKGLVAKGTKKKPRAKTLAGLAGRN